MPRAGTPRKPKPPGERRRPGRPTKLTYELADKIVTLIEKGVYVEVAAKACGVSKTRFYDWVAKAAEYDDADEELVEALDDETLMFLWFRYAYQRAEAQSEINLLETVNRAGTHWQAQMTILERRFPARWRRRDEIEHSGGISTTAPLTAEEEARELEAFGMAAAIRVAQGPEAVLPPANA